MKKCCAVGLGGGRGGGWGINPRGARRAEPPQHVRPEPCVPTELVATQRSLSLEKHFDAPAHSVGMLLI